ncbi:LUD domain-containing protein [Frankia sp. AiPa1]|uniref:LUD domain-containing protein n=1 Tax=Frankia sp. AiPa1 TaxID=573492 RepID=UPI00202B97A9|nr:LUD domain-containing protein [Frankia sp. AiPa1]MCL9760029.1 lactate utilization protein [Frankia sp. AiPa1]
MTIDSPDSDTATLGTADLDAAALDAAALDAAALDAAALDAAALDAAAADETASAGSPALLADESFAVPADEAALERAVTALRANGFIVRVVDTVADARALLAELLPRDREIFTASSQTLELSGITADIDESGEFVSVRAKAGPPTPDDLWATIRLGATPEVVVGSVHAVTENGQLLVASASGSQFAPYASGAKLAYWVVGAQKIMPDVETGLRRLHTYSLPREHQRLQERYNQGSVIGRILILEREVFPERGTVILVREAIGY